jgi:endonuclease/exonuclease/phosphatase family metal-dependent hydrolase
MRIVQALLFSVIVSAVTLSVATARQIDVIGWNMESGGADVTVLAEQIDQFAGIDIWGFSEVQNLGWASAFTEAAGEGDQDDYQMILGTTGGGDLLLIVYNATLFEEIRHFELHDINPLGRVRAPLVAQFREKETGQEFLFMVNHLYRSKADKRHEQSQDLNAWIQQQTLPVIAVGDYNYDWDVENGETQHDRGYDLLTANNVVGWVKPETLLPTNCHTQFTSVLDFIFVTNDISTTWHPQSTIEMSQENYCPDSDATSDHRPIKATFTLLETGGGTRALLLERISTIEKELQLLKEAVEKLPNE